MKNKNIFKKKLIEFSLIVTTIIIFAVHQLLTQSGMKDFPIGRSILAALLIGSIIGFYELYLSNILSKKIKKFLIYHLVSSLYYFVSFILVLGLLGAVTLFIKDNNFFSFKALLTVFSVYPNGLKEILPNLFFLTIIVSYVRLTKSLIGQDIIKNYMFGKYYLPISEKRIFLFMDLNNSSKFAELLGHLTYSNLIKDIYSMLDEIILETKAQLYQYVGDEIVMTWEPKKGIENNNSINFYFYVTQLLKNNEKYFLDKYGVFPEFKGSLHFGEVAVTEIGSLKKDIAFHGDTINTTARICQKVKELNSTLIISADLLAILPEIDKNYHITFLGIFELKGKNNIIGLNEISQKRILID